MHDDVLAATGRSRDELVAWLDGHTDFERAMPTRALAPTLRRIEELCQVLGDPEQACPVIHLTGTNGKGSTCSDPHRAAPGQRAAVGTYTSPNLARVNERLAIDGEPIGDDELADVLEAMALIEPMLSEPPTRFELLTAAAFRWFADSAVDVAVVEVGLGGRWDATNVVVPAVAVVTNVSYDHVEILGPTLGDIAGEKAGIIKPGPASSWVRPTPSWPAVFLAAAADRRRETWQAGRCLRRRRQPPGGGRSAPRPAHAGRLPRGLPAPARSPPGRNAPCALAAAEAFFGAPPAGRVVEEAFAAVAPCQVDSRSSAAPRSSCSTGPTTSPAPGRLLPASPRSSRSRRHGRRPRLAARP